MQIIDVSKYICVLINLHDLINEVPAEWEYDTLIKCVLNNAQYSTLMHTTDFPQHLTKHIYQMNSKLGWEPFYNLTAWQ